MERNINKDDSRVGMDADKAGSCFDGYHFSICEVEANRSGCLRMRTLLRMRIGRPGIGRRDLKYLPGKNLRIGMYL